MRMLPKIEGVCTNHHAIADFRVAVAAFFARTTQRYARGGWNIVAQDGGSPAAKTGGMVEHQAVTETGGRVDIDTEDFRHAVLQEIRQRFTAVFDRASG